MGKYKTKLKDYHKRKFLVVIDDTEECDRAVTFAAHRAKRTNGEVELISIIGNDQFQHWLGVENVLRAEAIEAANKLLDEKERDIRSIGDIEVTKIVREGRMAEEIEAQIAEDPDIAILVLAAGTSSEGPGPLVSDFTTRGANALPIPVTIIPGNVSDEHIIGLC
ncbi:MAG TPA: universal stress protein [Devosia sp.]|nr:universal stress protein [Devosia sp.]